MRQYIQDNYFQSYAYSYPHKSAYRLLEPAQSLESIWAEEKKNALFLYLHIPFCEMRCGFCNLFTIANPDKTYESPYLSALYRQAAQTKAALNHFSFARLAIGGGTPTFLNIKDLERLFLLVHDFLGLQRAAIPISVEMSPKTAEAEKLALLQEMGTTRASIGVQSFLLEETKALGRPQKKEELQYALKTIKDSGIAEMNIDLIYGSEGQSIGSWAYSIEAAMDYQPEEIFLYPLYVRPLTGLGMKEKEWNDHRLALYRAGRDLLLSNGYEQKTMRLFRRKGAVIVEGPQYHPAEDPMLGLGVGARSYTRNLHYSSEYAVSRGELKNIIHDYNQRSAKEFSYVDYGIRLDTGEQKRRYIIKSLLEGGGLSMPNYTRFFDSKVFSDFPRLYELLNDDLANIDDEQQLKLNLQGLELSDVIGPWLYSEAVQELMGAFDWR